MKWRKVTILNRSRMSLNGLVVCSVIQLTNEIRLLYHDNSTRSFHWELKNKDKIRLNYFSILTATQSLLPQIEFPSTPAVGVAMLSIVFCWNDEEAVYLNLVNSFYWSRAAPIDFFKRASIERISFLNKFFNYVQK